MRKNIFATLLSFLFVLTMVLPSAAQIVIDNCNTGPFSFTGNNFLNDLAASGAIGGTRDVQITNTNFGRMNLNTATGFLEVVPRSSAGFGVGNYDIGWGNNDFLGGPDLNINASSHSQIEVTFTKAPYNNIDIMTVRFNGSGDADYATSSLTLRGLGTYTIPFTSFAGLNRTDIDGISVGFSNCIPDTTIQIGNIQFSGVALPLALTSFTGQVKGAVNILRWETAMEQDIQYHVVERSIDGAKWEEIGRKNGQANSSVATRYSLEDRSPLAKAYYRLRSVDFDGKENRSSAFPLTRVEDRFGISSVFPSPADDNITVQFRSKQEELVTARVLDATGRLVLKQTTAAIKDINELRLALSGLQPGIYMVTVGSEVEISAPVRFVKQ